MSSRQEGTRRRTRGSWRPALRIARRDAGRHKLATALAMLLVALPVLAAVVVSTVRSSGDWTSENASYEQMGAADGQLEVTRHEAVTVRYRGEGTYAAVRPVDGADTPQRDPGSVDLEALLPAGSRLVPDAHSGRVLLDTGGRVEVRTLDLDDPISRGLGELLAGRAPQAPDEVAVPPVLADALGLLDGSGDLRADATLTASAGTQLHVVGLADAPDLYSLPIVVPPGSTLPGTAGDRWLVDLPELTPGQLLELRGDLAAHGVSVLLRDAVQHPEHWPELRDAPVEPADPMALVLGAVVVGLGAVEVVLLVGAALAVGARRQIRTLGLLASTGGSPRDVRRVFLARGLLVGGGGSLLATVLGLVGLRLALPLWDGAHTGPLHVLDMVWAAMAKAGGDAPLYVLDIVWLHVAAIVVLGTLSGVLAAAYPAWVVGRMTAVDALAGRFPTGHRPVTLPPVAAGLVAVGLVGVLGAGFWTAAEYAPGPNGDPAYGEPSVSTLPVAAGGLALLMLLAGVVWSTPYLVQQAGALSGRLGLAGRLAVRDAARHRQRTAAAVVGLTVTVAGSVLAGFGVDAAVATDTDGAAYQPPDTATIYAPLRGDRDAALARLRDTADLAIGADALIELRDATVLRDGRSRQLRLAGGGDVHVVDEDFLDLAGVDGAARAAYRDGAALVPRPGAVRDGAVELRAVQDRDVVFTEAVPATTVTTSWEDWHTGEVWISPRTAATLGADEGRSTLLVHKPGGFDDDDAETLEVLGINNEVSLQTSGYQVGLLTLVILGGGGLVTATAVGILVSLAAAEGRDDAATLSAVGAPPGRRRVMGAVHALFVGVIGAGLGLVVGSAAGASLLQAVGTPGVPVPWLTVAATVVAVPFLATVVGWTVTPSTVTLVRRTD